MIIRYFEWVSIDNPIISKKDFVTENKDFPPIIKNFDLQVVKNLFANQCKK